LASEASGFSSYLAFASREAGSFASTGADSSYLASSEAGSSYLASTVAGSSYFVSGSSYLCFLWCFLSSVF
jgi:hypothetical protein